MELSIVIPIFNEEKRIKPSLERLLAYLGSKSFYREIILVDDGSVDESITIAKSLLSSIQNVKVYLDGKQLNVEITSDEDSWLLSFTYMHSTHHVRISLATNAATTLLGTEYWIWIGAVIIIVAISMGLLLYLKKRKH